MRLLRVEDDTMIGESVLDLLRAEHYAVDWVRNGEMADAALRTQTYDLVFLPSALLSFLSMRVTQRARRWALLAESVCVGGLGLLALGAVLLAFAVS